MTLIKSVSGIRGTIGGQPGHNLTPADIVAFIAAYGIHLRKNTRVPVVAVGRDGRISGDMVKRIVTGTLLSMGIDVIDLDLSTTPSVEMYVAHHQLSGGIIITASHNPAEWNALKFLNHLGEFISPKDGEMIRAMAENGVAGMQFSVADDLGKMRSDDQSITQHIAAIHQHPLIDASLVRSKNFTAVVDAVNSTGSISIVPLLESFGVKTSLINGEITGRFAHNPEPLPEHLGELCSAVKSQKAHLGISVDPDVDRLALVDESGTFFGEEYTLVCAADYVLSRHAGPVVSNLSSSLALRDLADSYSVPCYYAPVGEVHVVAEMKKVKAVLGGEGNGGIIDPNLHYGRDAMIGVALVLMQLATSGKSLSELKSGYPRYEMVKDKIAFDPSLSPNELLRKVSNHFRSAEQDDRDGLKVILDRRWVQLRKSNTEPILRLYAEAPTENEARQLVEEVKALF